MSGAGRRTAQFTSALVVVTLLLPAGRALADDNEPSPTTWPTVTVVDQGSAAEPAPTEWPTLSTSDSAGGQASEPQPVDWPTPAQN
ncbi:hypothetical protein ACQHIV_31115 [Kribbella sp. GL6]|uniref:hypothetical protein n=1 Tax=Kribbella sp. GL6 TaxID=3419765 RepID=UPI003CFE686C